MLDVLKSFQPGTLLSVLFMLFLVNFYAGNVSAGWQDPWFSSLGLLLGIPVMLFKALASSSFGILAPLGALVVLAYIVRLQEAVGQGVYVCILAGWMLLSLGV